ncbi:14135_t:CDS:1, partial [Funneliformis geosporum]
IQLQLYQKSVEEIASIESGILKAKTLMKIKKNNQENPNDTD